MIEYIIKEFLNEKEFDLKTEFEVLNNLFSENQVFFKKNEVKKLI
jgi:hypothetical protein